MAVDKNLASDFLRLTPWQHYWADYGGWRGVRESKEIRVSILFCLCAAPIWCKEGWWDDVINITPSMLSFSLAAYAMIIGFGSDKLMAVLTTPILKKNEDGSTRTASPSAYASASAAFVHFIVVQTSALGLALFCKAWNQPYPEAVTWILSFVPEKWHFLPSLFIVVIWFLSYVVFIYSIVCGLSATMRLFTLKRWYALTIQLESKKEAQNEKEKESARK